MRQHTFTSSIGPITIAGDDDGLTFLGIGDDGSSDVRISNVPVGQYPYFATVEQAVHGYLAGQQTLAQVKATIPLNPQGTDFQKSVWNAFPEHGTTTYAELANRLGKGNAIRAVGTACGKNPISLFYPCHRVLGSDGKLHGYRWGIALKKQLLALEADFAARGLRTA